METNMEATMPSASKHTARTPKHISIHFAKHTMPLTLRGFEAWTSDCSILGGDPRTMSEIACLSADRLRHSQNLTLRDDGRRLNPRLLPEILRAGVADSSQRRRFGLDCFAEPRNDKTLCHPRDFESSPPPVIFGYP